MRAIKKTTILIAFLSLFNSFSTLAAEIAGDRSLNATKVTPLESLLPMLAGLIGILVVIFILAILVKKITGLNIVSNNIKVIESQSLGAKEKLVIVEVQQQQYLLGVTSQSINQICQLQNNIEKKSAPMPFDKIMKQFLQPKQITSDNLSAVNNEATAREAK